MLGFPKSKRITQKSEFDRTLNNGRRFVNRFFVVAARPSDGQNSRLGLIVSKKVGNAVVRNRVKRQIRETFRAMPQIQTPATDFVVIARMPAGLESGRVLKPKLGRAFAEGARGL